MSPQRAAQLTRSSACLSWQTFRTARTDAAGRWAIGYRFRRTRGLQPFLFRAQLPAETGYPYAHGTSRRIGVLVRGL